MLFANESHFHNEDLRSDHPPSLEKVYDITFLDTTSLGRNHSFAGILRLQNHLKSFHLKHNISTTVVILQTMGGRIACVLLVA